MPDVIQRDLAGVSLIALARVDGVVKVGYANRHEPRNHGLAVVSEEQRGKLVGAKGPSL